MKIFLVKINVNACTLENSSHILSPLSLILLKRLFVILCFESAEVFTFVKICQNKVLSEVKQLMKWVRIFYVRIFWLGVFRGGGVFQGGV